MASAFGAERVPQRIRGVGHALVHLVVEGAVVASVLRDELWIEQGVVEIRIEDAALLVGGAFDGQHAELAVPDALELRAHALEVPGGNFRLQIRARLLDADEGAASAKRRGPLRLAFGGRRRSI